MLLLEKASLQYYREGYMREKPTLRGWPLLVSLHSNDTALQVAPYLQGPNTAGMRSHLRLRTGSLPVNSVVSHFAASGTQCPSCGEEIETVDHFLLVCPAIAHLREKLVSLLYGPAPRGGEVRNSRERRVASLPAGLGDPSRMDGSSLEERLRFERTRTSILHDMWVFRCQRLQAGDIEAPASAALEVHADTV